MLSPNLAAADGEAGTVMSDEIEAIERAAAEDLHAAAGEELCARLGLAVKRIGSALVSVAGALPPSAIVINRTLGLGLGAEATEEELTAVVAAYRQAGVQRYFVHVHPDAQPADLGARLQARGLEKTRGWMKFARGREAVEPANTSLEIRPAGPEDAAAFGRIESAAFDLGPHAAPWLEALVGRSGWHIYMSFADGVPAGAGALFVRDDVAWLDWGATEPAFRGRGGQSAILRRRIAAALDLGCRLLVTATGEEVPGDPQHSYNNILRAGFHPAYVRDNHAPPKSG